MVLESGRLSQAIRQQAQVDAKRLQTRKKTKVTAAHNMALKPTHLVVTIFANSAKIAPPAARGLTRCYASDHVSRDQRGDAQSG